MDLPLTQVWGFKRAPLTWIYPSTSVGFQTSPSDLDLAGSSALGLPDRDQRLVDFGKAWSDRVKVRTRVNIYGTKMVPDQRLLNSSETWRATFVAEVENPQLQRWWAAMPRATAEQVRGGNSLDSGFIWIPE